MCKWLVKGHAVKIEFSHILEIRIKCEFEAITDAATRAEAERKIRLILQEKHYKVDSTIKAELW